MAFLFPLTLFFPCTNTTWHGERRISALLGSKENFSEVYSPNNQVLYSKHSHLSSSVSGSSTTPACSHSAHLTLASLRPPLKAAQQVVPGRQRLTWRGSASLTLFTHPPCPAARGLNKTELEPAHSQLSRPVNAWDAFLHFIAQHRRNRIFVF